jgi:putative transposase
MNEIREIWMRHPCFGYRRIREMLIRNGHDINRKCVARLMKVMNLQAIYPKPKTSIANREHRVYKYLLRDYQVTRPNEVWMVDITYIPMRHGFVYLVAIIDVRSRYIVGWNISIHLDTENCLLALDKALKIGSPEILNSDQGCQFTSDSWIQMLTASNIRISMDGKGRCLDNIFIERFWRTLKREDVYLKAYEGVAEARASIREYIDFYNNVRPHQSLGYKTPAEIYWQGKNSDELLVVHPVTHQEGRNEMLHY